MMIYVLCACFLWCSLKKVTFVQTFYCLNINCILMSGLVMLFLYCKYAVLCLNYSYKQSLFSKHIFSGTVSTFSFSLKVKEYRCLTFDKFTHIYQLFSGMYWLKIKNTATKYRLKPQPWWLKSKYLTYRRCSLETYLSLHVAVQWIVLSLHIWKFQFQILTQRPPVLIVVFHDFMCFFSAEAKIMH
jgi:hypothetical protein